MTNAAETDRPPVPKPQIPAGRRSSRSAVALTIGGIAVVWGSFSTWGSCPQEPCEGDFGLFHIFERTGIDFGPGIATAALGILLAVLGVHTLRNLGRVVRPGFAVLGAAAVLVTICIHLIRIYVVHEYSIVGAPYYGLYVTAVGGLVALVASVQQWQTRNAHPPP